MTNSLTRAFDEEIVRCFTFDKVSKASNDQVKLEDRCQISDFKECLSSLLNHYTFPLSHWFGTCLYGAFLEALDIKEQKPVEDCNLDISEDETIIYAFDHHSLVTSQLPDSYDDIVQTADEIIKEIDILMNDNEDIPLSLYNMVQSEYEHPLVSGNIGSGWLPEKAMQDLSLNELNALLEELESCVREYSSILVQELAYREELDFEQEQKDIFIARLNELHRRLERRRRLSMPSDGHIQLLSNSVLAIDNDEIFTSERNAQIDNVGLPPDSVHRETTQFILRAQSAAQAAVAATSSATIAIKKHLRKLSTFSKDISAITAHQSDMCIPVNTACTFPSSKCDINISSERDDHMSHSPTMSTRAIAIARLRKWAGRKSKGPSVTEHTNTFRAFLRRGRHQIKAPINLFVRSREARSAVTSPTSSHFEFPSIPTTLTHSASGHLIGRPELSLDDLEYKYLTTSVPYHRSPRNEGPSVNQLELFNDMLLAILTNNPNLTPMLTDYILNVYAPADRRLSKLTI
ncbi:putative zygin isoform 3 [Schistosoma japonicum]|uniref:Putative zygin isoform 3 n=1 Tax=Schistosoma japonicum TaxID=6182 RepID=A0A4Z2CN85_SCHJA|nr:Fasciculation and elongation protein zeta-2 [Schistosoma japonicum]KAH8854268.1 Fasciculation and elongation protein zeta-2 [Schistosoma japonicum]KAH8854270.1 Fasciculation and elongation protein zeta-2 [Schistosoma japonicum]TNN05648.1 putative zygin isoform 3 [Schistosoma japonicum]